MAKKIVGSIKLQVKAGQATPTPPIGPALGQKGLNIMEFCKAFNAKTSHLPKDTPIPVLITVYGDRTFSFTTKQPPASFLIKKAIGLKEGSKLPGRTKAGEITMDDLREIVREKIIDMNTEDHEEALKTFMGTARSMGVEVIA